MNNIKTIIKYELLRYFLSPLAYVYLISFLLLSGSCAIYFGHFFVNDQANLWSLFDYQPWIYLLFIPGISMRSWAEEFRSKSIVQLLTTPVSLPCLVWGKFFASWFFAIFSILLTFPFWITVNIYGHPDNMVIFVGYLSCFILAGAMLAISQTMSALTKNPVISLVLSVFVNLLFFWSGFDYVLFWARELFSDVIVDTIISFSFLAHFDTLSRGLVEFRDIIYFGSLIIFFNLLSIVVISLKTKGVSGIISSSSLKHGFIVLLLLFVGFFSLNVIANNLLRQISYDFTEEKYLSLTKNTKDILRKLHRPITAKLYYSPILGQRNPQVRVFFDQIKLLLKQYKTYGHGYFDYRIYTPQFLDKIEDKAIADGLQPIPLIDINQNALFGIVFADNLTNKSVIPFFSVERLPFVEQDFTTNIYKLGHKKKTLGLLSSLPVMGNVRQEGVTLKRWEIMDKIGELYNVRTINKIEDLDEKFDVFMLVHPYALSDELVEKIKKQDKILLLLDVADDASRIYSPASGAFVSSNLSGLADYWNIDFYDTGVVADFNNSITVDETINYKKNPSFTQDLLQFKTTAQELNPNHRITYKLNNILFSSASMILPKDEKAVSFFPLIKSSSVASLMVADFAKKNKSPREVLAAFKPLNSPIVIAAEILSNNPHKPFDIIAVADTDFIYDSFWTKERTFLNSTYHVPFFDNGNFVLNALDYLTENDDLISLRGKSLKKRPLYKVDKMRKNNTYRYKLKENDIFEAIDGVRQQLTEITVKRNFEERENFTPDELAVIGKIRNEMADLRQQLSVLRINANNNIEALEIKVKFFNIYFISILILLILGFFVLRKKKLSLSLIKNIFVWDKKLFKLFLCVLVLVLLAGITVYTDNENTISKYEDKPVFKDFGQYINKISAIKLSNHSQTLTFVRKNGIWMLDEYPNLPVYQERIFRLLVALNNMTFSEKKSDKIEDMKFFGFSSLKDENSPMINLSLFDEKNNVLENFDIGWHDIDIGRGSKAAYIRLNNQFQIWLAEVDFYDLSLDKNAWTYSSLWNLRFGRFISYNSITDNAKVMNMVKKLLNLYLENVFDKVNAEKIAELNIKSENNNFINLLFYKSKDNRYYVQYDFINKPHGKHLEFFAKYVKDKYLEISQETWDKIKDDTIRTK